MPQVERDWEYAQVAELIMQSQFEIDLNKEQSTQPVVDVNQQVLF